MKRLTLLALLAAVTVPASAFAAVDVNPSGPVYKAITYYYGHEAAFGDVSVVANKAGATLTWTQQETLAPFIAGHTYKEIAKIAPQGQGWCGPIDFSSDVEPFWGFPQKPMYWKEMDQTTGHQLACHD